MKHLPLLAALGGALLAAPAKAKSPSLGETLYHLDAPKRTVAPGEPFDLVGWADFDAACERFWRPHDEPRKICSRDTQRGWEQAGGAGPWTANVHFYPAPADPSAYPDLAAKSAFVVRLKPLDGERTAEPCAAGTTVIPDDLPPGRYVARPEGGAPYDDRLVDDPLFTDGIVVGSTSRFAGVAPEPAVRDGGDASETGDTGGEAPIGASSMKPHAACAATPAGSGPLASLGLIAVLSLRRGRSRR